MEQVQSVLSEAGLEQIEMIPLPALRGPESSESLLRPLADQVADVERQAISAAMGHVNGNKLAAAKLLGISRATLYERLQKMYEK